MIRARHYLSIHRTLASLAVFAVVGASCRDATPPCAKAPLVDAIGASAEQARIDRQWLAIQGRLDSASSTGDGIHAERSMQGRLDSSIARYGDSLRRDGASIVSRSGCIDWQATWEAGQLDRTALATAWLRALVADGVGVVEWSVIDTASASMRLQVHFTRPGSDGGTLDAAEMSISPERVEVVDPSSR
jgi:hypothetical protein